MTLDEQIEALVTHTPGFWQLDACGVTRTERGIPALMHGTAQPPAGERIQLVLIGGLSGKQEDADAALAALNSYSAASGLSDRVALSAVPCGNPDGLALGSAPENGAGGNPSAAYPPPGDTYYDANPEAHYLWRWVSFQGPDLALEIRVGAGTTWQASAPCQQLLSQFRSTLNVSELPSDSSLLAALATGEPNLLPPVPSLRLTCAAADLAGELAKLWTVLAQVPDHARSATRSALQARVARSPLAVARILAGVYGHELDPVIYTQGVAVSGRLRLAQLDPDGTDPSADIEAIAAPYMSGAKPWFPAGGDGGANLAGLVWADELAATTGNDSYADLLVQTADRYRAAHDNGVPSPSNPNYQVEDMFFTAAVLGRAFKLTGDDAYLNILTRFLLDANVQQDDGLFWHDRAHPLLLGARQRLRRPQLCRSADLPARQPSRPGRRARHPPSPSAGAARTSASQRHVAPGHQRARLLPRDDRYLHGRLCAGARAAARLAGCRPQGSADAGLAGGGGAYRRPRRPRRCLHRHRRPAKSPRLPRPARHIRPRRARRRPINLVRHRNGKLPTRELTRLSQVAPTTDH